jgi:hypothetical protein
MRIKRIRHVEPEGFYHGTQGVPQEPMLGQIQAQFELMRARLCEKFARIVKRLEARREVLRERQERARSRLQELIDETGGRPPEILVPLFWLILGLCAVAGEVILIAPVLDGWGIANPEAQLFAASVIVLTASGLFDRVLRRIRDDSHRPPITAREFSRAHHLLTIALGAFAFALLAAFGFWRANEMIFAASVRGGEWGSFLASNPTLTRASVMLLTVGLPLFAALTMDWGFRELRLGFAWWEAKATIAHCADKLAKLGKRHEEEKAVLAEKLKALEEEERNTTHAYQEHHDLGVILGAVRERLSWVFLRCAGLALLLIVACMILDPFLGKHIASSQARIVLYVLATGGTVTLYLAYALKRWERPSPRDLYRNRAVRWREEGTTEVHAISVADEVRSA